MVTYFLNWMGPINLRWIEKHGDQWAVGRIDVSDDTPFGTEYSVPPMHVEDWGELWQWLDHHKTPVVWSFQELIETFEKKRLGRSIRWMEGE